MARILIRQIASLSMGCVFVGVCVRVCVCEYVCSCVGGGECVECVCVCVCVGCGVEGLERTHVTDCLIGA